MDEFLPVSKLKDAESLHARVQKLHNDRIEYEKQWKLNMAFYKGKQYSFYNDLTRQIESLPVDDGDKPRYRVRLISNQIMPGSQSLLAKLTKTKPVMVATPGSGSDQDRKAAQMAQALLEHWWTDLGLDDKLEEALLWSIIAGQGYWKISWDPYAGKQMRFLMDPNGQPVTDQLQADVFRSKLQQYGVEPMETAVYLGDVKVEVLSPFQVLLDPNPSTASECMYAFCEHYLDPDEVQARWKKKVQPDVVPSDIDSQLKAANHPSAASPSLATVWTGYFRPSATVPNGRVVSFTRDTILSDEPWPYPFDTLPLVKFPGVRVPGQILDSCEVEQAIPIQKELNRTLSQIVQHKNLSVKPRYWAPVNSITARITDEPGAIYEYNPVAGLKPEPERPPELASYIFPLLQDISMRLRDAFNLTEVTEGTVPPNVEAGIAIDLLQEMATDRLAPKIKLLETALAGGGQMLLTLAQKYYIEPRLMKIQGSGGSIQSRRFTQADLNANLSVMVEAGSALPRTRAGRQARIERYVEMGILRPDEAYKYIDLADLKGVAAKFKIDEDKAYREHDKLINGMPINPDNLQRALQAIQQGIDPESGQPFEGEVDEYQLMEIIRRAGLTPGPADNHAVEFEIHAMFAKSIEFEGLPADVRQDILTHIELTRSAMASLPVPEPFAPRVNLQLKSTVGPSAQAKILQQAGVPVSVEETMEPPLETWVSDDVDMPDADSAGPGQEGTLVKAASSLQDMAHKEAMHEQELRRATANADAAERPS